MSPIGRAIRFVGSEIFSAVLPQGLQQPVADRAVNSGFGQHQRPFDESRQKLENE